MRRNSKVSKKDFTDKEVDLDWDNLFSKDKTKENRRANKQRARKRRQQIKEKRYEDDWN